jgi:hypothetical protein
MFPTSAFLFRWQKQVASSREDVEKVAEKTLKSHVFQQ